MPVAPEFQQVSGDGRVLAWLADPWEAPYLNDFTSPMSLRMNDS